MSLFKARWIPKLNESADGIWMSGWKPLTELVSDGAIGYVSDDGNDGCASELGSRSSANVADVRFSESVKPVLLL